MWKSCIVLIWTLALFALSLLETCSKPEDKYLTDIQLDSVFLTQNEFAPDVLAEPPKASLNTFDNAKQSQLQLLVRQDGETVGAIEILVFAQVQDRDQVFNLLSLVESQEGIVDFPIPQIGESSMARQELQNVILTLKRCSAVVSISVHPLERANQSLVKLAQRIDHQLQNVACKFAQ